VWKFVRRLVGNDADARDVYQETFLQAFQFSRKASVDDWIRLLRKRYRSAAYFDSDVVSGSEELPCSGPLPEEQLAADELSDRLRIALTRLTEEQSEVFVMRYVEDLPYDEIASRTGSNRNAVGVMLNRARGQLQQLLASDTHSQSDIRPASQETSG
jgi:RNA polymerase sigma-70 factor (ECF subfamily)